ncbi:MAG: histidine kinase [Bacteroides sp.]|nr:histidine kinase [Bacteroides sp.]
MKSTSENHVFADFLLRPDFRLYRHLLLQLFILVITTDVLRDPLETDMNLSREHFFSWLVYFLIMNALIYVNIYILVPRYLLKDKLWKYLGATVVALALCMLVIFHLASLVSHPVMAEPSDQLSFEIWLNAISSPLAIGLLVAGVSTLLLLRYWIQTNLKKEELQQNSLQAELTLLKNQINPHFLFNMLNNANVLIRRNPEEASKVLLKLEDLLRYQIHESSRDRVLLVSEIRFLNDFLNLEKIRRDRFEYTLSREGDIGQVSLPPLLFIPFVENAVKYSFDSEQTSVVEVCFRVRDKQLEFCCRNTKPVPAVPSRKVGGLGLANIKRRLELLYPDRYSLHIQDAETEYRVQLFIRM